MHKQLLNSAEFLAKRTKKPVQADLRRAVSSAYYAMFHALCEMCADCIHGGKSADRCERAWTQTYRAVDHRAAKGACGKCPDRQKYNFPEEIEKFAEFFVTMQEYRHRADYAPNAKYSRQFALDVIESARGAIANLTSVPPKHKKAFAAFVLFKER